MPTNVVIIPTICCFLIGSLKIKKDKVNQHSNDTYYRSDRYSRIRFGMGI